MVVEVGTCLHVHIWSYINTTLQLKFKIRVLVDSFLQILKVLRIKTSLVSRNTGRLLLLLPCRLQVILVLHYEVTLGLREFAGRILSWNETEVVFKHTYLVFEDTLLLRAPVALLLIPETIEIRHSLAHF